MQKLVFILSFLFSFSFISKAQYDAYDLNLSFGVNYSKYLGAGESDNVFNYRLPGIQVEFISNNGRNFEWVVMGIQYFKLNNTVGVSKVPVTFWIPYYTEFIFYQATKKNPLFIFAGYDYVRMKFEEMKEADGHHNITFGGGWNLGLTEQVYLQFKLKPYFILDNSIGQHFGVNFLVNIHLGLQ